MFVYKTFKMSIINYLYNDSVKKFSFEKTHSDPLHIEIKSLKNINIPPNTTQVIDTGIKFLVDENIQTISCKGHYKCGDFGTSTIHIKLCNSKDYNVVYEAGRCVANVRISLTMQLIENQNVEKKVNDDYYLRYMSFNEDFSIIKFMDFDQMFRFKPIEKFTLNGNSVVTIDTGINFLKSNNFKIQMHPPSFSNNYKVYLSDTINFDKNDDEKTICLSIKTDRCSVPFEANDEILSFNIKHYTKLIKSSIDDCE